MSQVLYNDLTKQTSDFIKKDFPESFKLESTLRHKYGSIVATTDIKEGGIVGTVQPKFDVSKFVNRNTNANLTIDTNGVKKGEITIENLVPGLKTIINGDAKQNVSTEVQYKKDKVALTVFGKNDKSYTTSISFAANNMFTFGIQADGNAKNTLKNVNATLLVKPRNDIIFTIVDRFMDKQLLFSGLYFATPKLTVGGDLTVDLKASDKSPSFNIGTAYKIDSVTFIKAKINNNKKANIAFTHTLNQNAKIGLGWNINAANLKQGNTFGAILNLTI
ncbi:hypothetical protein RB653_010002 [Dictyostelium firmibasis]|uniref:Voltage-dependent anion-selective channel protein n=1 Tax=Dictyostelium firmibasis TaxID=79012 RepID=A0AAN7TK62_9MYCE